MIRRRRTAVLLIFVVSFLVLLAAAWLARFRFATAIVDRKLRAAGVTASYQLTRIGPFLERMEDVRLGDPAAPDLIARRIDVAIGYALSGPYVRSVAIDGVRLRGRYDAQGLHLGQVDRLLPKGGGAGGLPDINVSIRDAEVAVATPAGALSLAVQGDGNPARRFRGDVRLAALSLGAGGCVARDVAAMLKVATDSGKPTVQGPVRVTDLTCPERQIALGQGAAQIVASADAKLQRVSLDANLAGLGGRIQSLRFAGMQGAISGSRSATGFGAQGKVDLASASLPDLARTLAGAARSSASAPLGGAPAQALTRFSALARQADASIRFDILQNGRNRLEARLHRLMLTGRNGARVIVNERGGLSWTQAGLRTDADVAIGGGGLPELAVQLRQSAPNAPIAGLARLQTYRAGDARIAATPVRFTWNGVRATFDTVVSADGAIGDGFVRGLTVPVRGHATRTGAVELDAGCAPVSFDQLRLSSFTFDAARVVLCGDAIVARTSTGGLRIAAQTEAIALSGHTADGAPVRLGAAQLAVTQAGFRARQLTATLGGPVQPTHLAIESLDGAIGRRGIGGRFAGAAGAIGNVPLNIADASGGWTLANSVLALDGRLQVSDADAAARFRPLATDNARLGLNNGVITAAATLRELTSQATIAQVDLTHNLSRGTGHALLDVPGITFVPKGLQPERLTPLTLGVIANVAGTVSGRGRIDWSAKGVTSSGDFGSERLDLAAAFGPVTGLKGQIHFTDLLGLVTPPGQEATIAEINPGVAVTNGTVHYQLIGQNRVRVEDGHWPFAGGDLTLDPTTLSFGGEADRNLTFRIKGLDAAAFIQQLDFPNISATGTFDGVLPMIFDQRGGRIEQGKIVARPGGGTLAYIGAVTNAQLGTMGKLAFDALKAIRYSALDISLDGRLDGEMVSVVRFTGVREATPEQSMITRLIRNLPFRFNIAIRAPFRGLVGSARAYIDPRLLLTQGQLTPAPTPAEPPIQPPASGDVR